MRSQVWIVTLTLGLSAGAAFAQSPQAPEPVPSTWEWVTTTVKVTVNNWISYFKGEPAPAAVPAVAPAARPKAVAKAPAILPKPAAVPQQDLAPVAAAPAASKPVVPLSNQEAMKELRAQPLFEAKATGSSLKDVQAVRDSVKSSQVLKVKEHGRSGTSKLAKSTAGVPTVNWAQLKKIKKIPRLDIGVESLISKEDLTVGSLNWSVQKPSTFKKLPSAKAIAEIENTPIPRALSARGLQANIRTVGQPLTQEQVDKVKYAINAVPEFKDLPYKPLSEEMMKMVAVLILFERGDHCHMIMGMFKRLAETEKTKIEATYHLGACAAQLKMHQSAFDNLSVVVASEDKEFAPDALGILAKDLLIIYEKDFYKLVKGLKNPKALLNDKNHDDVSYRLAKGAYRAGDYKTSISYATQVASGSEYYDDARFLVGMNSFALNDKGTALKKLQELWDSIESRKISGNIRALTSLNLARMYFAQKKYDKALDLYMQVPKDHPLWVQALIEQGWTQLALDDYSGAIGNMYSLHSPYFKAVYQPESFVVRTIGYLNICQYGDAYKSLTWLERDYRDWNSKAAGYLSSKGNADAIYATVKTYIRGKSTDDVDGVPYQVWREMAHRKDFLNLQTALNDKTDETKRYEGVNEKIKQEKASIRARGDLSKKRFDQWRTKIAKAVVDKTSPARLDEMRSSQKLERDSTIGYRFQLSILEQSREGYLEFQKSSQSKLDNETASLSTKAGDVLLSHAKTMQQQMSQVLENNEFLRYEVFSGSGENIRYQVAGGQVSGESNRIPANIKPTKMMNWNFDGEFWEDEIGAYRSSLQNSCPVNQQAQQAQKAERVPASAEEQARHSNEDEN
jgi:tetratricopeptide (TPR) repeat protein